MTWASDNEGRGRGGGNEGQNKRFFDRAIGNRGKRSVLAVGVFSQRKYSDGSGRETVALKKVGEKRIEVCLKINKLVVLFA